MYLLFINTFVLAAGFASCYNKAFCYYGYVIISGLKRSGKSCRLRWMNYLQPDLRREPISKQEEDLIVSLQKLLGNR